MTIARYILYPGLVRGKGVPGARKSQATTARLARTRSFRTFISFFNFVFYFTSYLLSMEIGLELDFDTERLVAYETTSRHNLR